MTQQAVVGGRWRNLHSKFVVEERYLPRATRARLYAASAIMITIGLAAFIVLLVAVVTHSGVELWDAPVEKWFDAQRNADTTGFMIVVAIVFGPVAMPIIVTIVAVVWIIAAKHAWRPILLAAGMATGVILSQVLAPIVKHPRPPIALMLFGPDHSYSFPSGHVLGAADFFLLMAFLLASRRQQKGFTIAAFVIAALGIGLQVASRLYLGYHWISDTASSVALSLVVVGVIIAIDTHRTVRVRGERIEGKNSQLQVDGT
jgi:membrane-associated phospholipid phosphatase